MSTWTARAKAYFSGSPQGWTDKTDRTHVSSVLSVSRGAVCEKRDGVLSVLSVGVAPNLESRKLAEDLLTAAMLACDHHRDGIEAREAMQRDVLNLPEHLRADLLSHFQSEYQAGVAGDIPENRRVCTDRTDETGDSIGGGDRQLTELELAAKMAYYVGLGRERQKAADDAAGDGSTEAPSAERQASMRLAAVLPHVPATESAERTCSNLSDVLSLVSTRAGTR